MRTRNWPAIALLAVALLLAGPTAFAKDGYIEKAELSDKIQIGVTTRQQVIELLGEPLRVEDFARSGVDSLGYWIDDWGKRLNVSIDLDTSGVVRNVERLPVYGS